MIDTGATRIKLQIWDTAGQEKYRSIVQTYYKGASGIILTYAVNDRTSFMNVEKWVKQIQNDAIENVVVILVGNKCDLPNREVEVTEGQRLADKYGMKFFETSATSGVNVKETFFRLGKEIDAQFGDQLRRVRLPKKEPIVNLTSCIC